MKFKQFLAESKTGSLLGKKIGEKVITADTKNEKWEGNFVCSGKRLTSLEHAPTSIGGDFYCSDNQLTSLEHAPTSIGGDFYCHNNQLTSLEHAPASIGGDFYCAYNNLTSLEHAPTSVGGHFYCAYNNLTSLEHAPTSVGGHFYCTNNHLTSLYNVHKLIKEINGTFYCQGNPITGHLLGVLLIKGCTKLLFRPDVDRIINKYLPNTRGMAAVNECQDELIEADLEDFAEL